MPVLVLVTKPVVRRRTDKMRQILPRRIPVRFQLPHQELNRLALQAPAPFRLRLQHALGAAPKEPWFKKTIRGSSNQFCGSHAAMPKASRRDSIGHHSCFGPEIMPRDP